MTARAPMVERGLAELWRQVEQLEARAQAAERRIATLERRTGAAPAEARVSVATAARALGCDDETVRRLIREGALRGRALLFPGRSRRTWIVDTRSLQDLLATAATAAPIMRAAGPRANRGGESPA